MKAEAIKLVTNSIKSLFTPNEKYDVAIDELITLNNLNGKNISLPNDLELRIPIGGKNYMQSTLIYTTDGLKPKTEVVKVSKHEMMAASGNNGGGSTHWEDDGDGPGGRPGETGWAKQSGPWEDSDWGALW